MTRSTGQRRHHFKLTTPSDSAVTPLANWPEANRRFFKKFCEWLQMDGYEGSTLHHYSVPARLALGYLNKPYWAIHAETDLERVRVHLTQGLLSLSTQQSYCKGLKKFGEYLLAGQEKPVRPRILRWEYHLNSLPDWLCEAIREFIAHRQKSWRVEDRHRRSMELLSQICGVLRSMQASAPLNSMSDITPQRWFCCVDEALEKNRHPNTINCRLAHLQAFLRFQDENGAVICQRMLLVQSIQSGPLLPRDVPISELRRLFAENELETLSKHAGQRRMGIMDRAWLHLMLHSGLRTGEVRRLRLEKISFDEHRIRIEQSKGLKDRLVFLDAVTIRALQTWLAEPGVAKQPTDLVFSHRHQPLTSRYCQVRLQTYGRRCGVRFSPHQLRHSCATLLLNAGAPVTSVQALLGHEKVETTLGYARLYDGTLAADYYRAMGQVENLFELSENKQIPLSTPAELIALVDSLGSGTLNEQQREVLQALKNGILSLSGGEPMQV